MREHFTTTLFTQCYMLLSIKPNNTKIKLIIINTLNIKNKLKIINYLFLIVTKV